MKLWDDIKGLFGRRAVAAPLEPLPPSDDSVAANEREIRTDFVNEQVVKQDDRP